MDFISNKMRRIFVLLGVVLLVVGVVWPFLRGGQALIQTGFEPINAAMGQLLDNEHAESKQDLEKISPTGTPSKLASSESASTSSSSSSNSSSNSSTNPSTNPSPSPNMASSSASTSSPDQHSSNEAHSGRLDLNTATMEQLDKLPGIGASKAKAIIEYRTKKGRFKRVEELKDVKGIGEKMLEKLRDHVFVVPS